jgi:hypothetical protein
LLHFWFLISPKGSKEGTKFRVKTNRPRKTSDICEDGDKVSKESHVHCSQSTSLQNSSDPDPVVYYDDLLSEMK